MSPRSGDGWGEAAIMTVARARALRKRMTAEELTLWFQLRQLKALGWRFRRQSPEEPHILEFVCREASLVIEVDGAHHRDPKQSEYDARRDLFLREHGLTCAKIWMASLRRFWRRLMLLSPPVVRRLRLRTTPSPSREGIRSALRALRSAWSSQADVTTPQRSAYALRPAVRPSWRGFGGPRA